MAKLIYTAITSVDGYIEDENGNFEWGIPNEQVHCFINNLERSIGLYLYGRRMYEVMDAWEKASTFSDQPPFIQEFAYIWQAADKIVFSKTMNAVSSARTRIERDFVPDAIREMKLQAAKEISVGGPELASHAFIAGLVDECHIFLAPIVVGGGKRFLPDTLHLKLELLDENCFNNGMVHLHYQVVS